MVLCDGSFLFAGDGCKLQELWFTNVFFSQILDLQKITWPGGKATHIFGSFHRDAWGKMNPCLTIIFFDWVGSTTN